MENVKSKTAVGVAERDGSSRCCPMSDLLLSSSWWRSIYLPTCVSCVLVGRGVVPSAVLLVE